MEGLNVRSFEGGVAVVTGAASGLGEALATHCAELGMSVVLADVNRDALETIRKKLASLDTTTLLMHIDVANSVQMAHLAEATWKSFGRVDLLFNNAGILIEGFCWEIEPESWQRLLNINVMGVVNGMYSFLPGMLKQDYPSRIINTASLAGFSSAPKLGAYSASKQAVVSISETMHHELRMKGASVKVSVLCPGPIATDILNSRKSALSEMIDAGMAPAECAAITFEAINAERFWIFPHTGFKPRLERRMKSIYRETNPEF